MVAGLGGWQVNWEGIVASGSVTFCKLQRGVLTWWQQVREHSPPQSVGKIVVRAPISTLSVRVSCPNMPPQPLKVPSTPLRSSENDKDKTPVAAKQSGSSKLGAIPKDISSPHELTAFVNLVSAERRNEISDDFKYRLKLF